MHDSHNFFFISNKTLIKICLILVFLNFTILGSAMSLDNYLMKIKVPSSAFFIKNINSEGRDWTSGETWGVSLSLSESIRYNKKLKFSKLKADKLPIPADFLPVFDETEF